MTLASFCVYMYQNDNFMLTLLIKTIMCFILVYAIMIVLKNAFVWLTAFINNGTINITKLAEVEAFAAIAYIITHIYVMANI